MVVEPVQDLAILQEILKVWFCTWEAWTYLIHAEDWSILLFVSWQLMLWSPNVGDGILNTHPDVTLISLYRELWYYIYQDSSVLLSFLFFPVPTYLERKIFIGKKKMGTGCLKKSTLWVK